MRREHKRHPFFETLVFGLALALFLVLVWFGGHALLRARGGDDAVRPSPDVAPVAARPLTPPLDELNASPTIVGVSRLPPVAVTKVARTSHKTKEVPVPK